MKLLVVLLPPCCSVNASFVRNNNKKSVLVLLTYLNCEFESSSSWSLIKFISKKNINIFSTVSFIPNKTFSASDKVLIAT